MPTMREAPLLPFTIAEPSLGLHALPQLAGSSRSPALQQFYQRQGYLCSLQPKRQGPDEKQTLPIQVGR